MSEDTKYFFFLRNSNNTVMTRTTMITASRKVPPTPATVPTVETEKLPSMLSSSELGDETEVIGETKTEKLGCMVSYPKVKDEAEGEEERKSTLSLMTLMSTFYRILCMVIKVRLLRVYVVGVLFTYCFAVIQDK